MSPLLVVCSLSIPDSECLHAQHLKLFPHWRLKCRALPQRQQKVGDSFFPHLKQCCAVQGKAKHVDMHLNPSNEEAEDIVNCKNGQKV